MGESHGDPCPPPRARYESVTLLVYVKRLRLPCFLGKGRGIRPCVLGLSHLAFSSHVFCAIAGTTCLLSNATLGCLPSTKPNHVRNLSALDWETDDVEYNSFESCWAC